MNYVNLRIYVLFKFYFWVFCYLYQKKYIKNMIIFIIIIIINSTQLDPIARSRIYVFFFYGKNNNSRICSCDMKFYFLILLV